MQKLAFDVVVRSVRRGQDKQSAEPDSGEGARVCRAQQSAGPEQIPAGAGPPSKQSRKHNQE